MIFTIFRDFFDFIFDLKTLKIIKKNDKRGFFFTRVPRGCDVALGVTWQRHTGPHDAYAAYTYTYFI